MKDKICKGCGHIFTPKSSRSEYCGEIRIGVCKLCGKEFKYVCKANVLKDKCSDCKGKYIKVCKYCGETFITISPTKEICDNIHYKICPICGKKFPVKNNRLSEDLCCSKSCANERRNDHIKNTLDSKESGWNQSKTIYHKICKYCGKEFETTHYNKEYCDNPHFATCVVCGKKFEISIEQIKRGTITCSSKCSRVLASKTALQKYGVDSYSKTEQFKKRIQNKYTLARQKQLSTNVSKFGKASVSCTDEWLSKFMSDPSKLPELKKFLNNPKQFIDENFSGKPTITVLSKFLGVNSSSVAKRIRDMGCKDLVDYHTSNMEIEVLEFIKQECPNLKIITHDRQAIAPLELDIYLPDKQIAIECNPTASHNSSWCPWDKTSKGLSPSYHKNKSLEAEKAGIFLFHLFGYEWTYKQSIIKSMLRNLLGCTSNKLYARNCKVVELTVQETRKFLDENHRQGYVYSKVNLGLQYNNDIVSIMTFSPVRHTIGTGKNTSDEIWELVRFCSKLNISVVGAASKLFKYFINNYPVNIIRSFSDVARTKGTLYQVLGFKYLRDSKPGYVWIDNKTDIAYSRINAQKSNIKTFLHDDTVDLNQSEKEIMESHGFVRVYDSGTKIWEWNRYN